MPNPSPKAIEPTPATRCCGVWVARWRWSILKSGAGSSISTSRCPQSWPRGYVLAEAAACRRGGSGRLPVGCTPCAPAARRTAPAASPVKLEPGHQPACHRGDRQHRTASDPTARARWGPKRSSRCPGIPARGWRSWPTASHRPGRTSSTVAADATDAAAMSALFDRFGTDLPPLEGIYLAAFAGGPVSAQRHDRRRRRRHVPAQAGRRGAAAPAVADNSRCGSSFCSPRSRVSSVRGGWPTTPRPAPSWIPSPTRVASSGCRPPSSTGDCGNPWPTPKTTRAPGQRGIRTRPDARRGRHRRAAAGDEPGRRSAVRPWSPRTGPCWPPHIGRGDRCASSTTCCRRQTRRSRCRKASSAKPCANCQPRTPTRHVVRPRRRPGRRGDGNAARPKSLDPSAGFFQLGMDSLMSVTLQRALVRKPRRVSSGVCRLRLPDRRQPHRLSGHYPSRADRGRRPTRPSTPTTTSPKPNCCNNFRKG